MKCNLSFVALVVLFAVLGSVVVVGTANAGPRLVMPAAAPAAPAASQSHATLPAHANTAPAARGVVSASHSRPGTQANPAAETLAGALLAKVGVTRDGIMPSVPDPGAPTLTVHVRLDYRSPLGQGSPYTLILSNGSSTETFFPISDDNGNFTVEVPEPGIYSYWIKTSQSLANFGTVDIEPPGTTADFGVLLGGDVNNDNLINSYDYAPLKGNFGKGAHDPGYDARADLNADDVVNTIDLNVLKRNFGLAGAIQGPPSRASSAPSRPYTGNDYMQLRPQGSAPPNGGTVAVGSRFVLELWVNASANPAIVQQSYLTFTNSLLQNADVSSISTSCSLASTVTRDVTTFDQQLQNEVCNGPGSCTFVRSPYTSLTVPPGSLAFASGALNNCSDAADCPGQYRVAQIGLCATAPGQAVLHWQFSPDAPVVRDTEILNTASNAIYNPALFSDYVINIAIPTITPTPTQTGTPTNTPTVTLTNSPTNTPTSTASNTPLNTPTFTYTPTLTGTSTNTRTPTPTPYSTWATHYFVPEPGAPTNGGTVMVGDRFVLDLSVNSGIHPDLTAQQAYLTFTNSVLQNARVDQIATTCVPTNTVTGDFAVFDANLQDEVCNGPGNCTFRGVTTGPGTMAFASGALNNSPAGGTFRVARIAFCAVGPGTAILHWQFSPPAITQRDTEIVDGPGNIYNDRSTYPDYIINVAAPTNTPTSTPNITNTPTTTPVIVGHVVWQGRAAIPSAIQQLPITLTLKLGSTEVNYAVQTTDSYGFFTVPVGSLVNGTYSWRAKDPKYLANSGSVALAGAQQTNLEIGLMRAGDCDNNNSVGVTDFNILRATLGKSLGQPGYDARADFSGDNVVNTSDFNLLRGNYGLSGGAPIGPGGP